MAKSQTFFEHSLLVTSFLGGITFAAMILLMQDQTAFHVAHWIFSPVSYSKLLIIGTAFTSVLFIISTVGLIRLGSGEKNKDDSFGKLVDGVATSGYVTLMVLLPALIFPFSKIGAYAIGFVELTLMVAFLWSYHSSS